MGYLSEFTDNIGKELDSAGSRLGESFNDAYEDVENAVKDALPYAAWVIDPYNSLMSFGAGFLGAQEQGMGTNESFWTGFANPGKAWSGEYSSNEYLSQAALSGAVLAGGAAYATMAAPSVAAHTLLGLQVGTTTTAGASALTSLAVGGAVGYGAYEGIQAMRSDDDQESGGASSGAPAVDMNGQDTSAQFQRLRKAARMLGRAGTFRGGKSLGGPEGSLLGEQLALTGT